VDVAAHAHAQLRLAEAHLDLARPLRLRVVLIRVARSIGVEMHVVRGRVGIVHAQRLSHTHADHVWRIQATFLIEIHGSARRCRSAASSRPDFTCTNTFCRPPSPTITASLSGGVS